MESEVYGFLNLILNVKDEVSQSSINKYNVDYK